MRIGEDNYIEQLCLHNEEALVYVIDIYGGLLKSVISKHLFNMPDKVEECLNDVLLNIWENITSCEYSGRADASTGNIRGNGEPA